MFKVSKGNSKLGRIYNINLPAIKTCVINAPCRKICYATKGTYNFPNVKNCYEENLQSFLDNPFIAKCDILKQLPEKGEYMVRWHSSGDIPNMTYFRMIIEIAEERPNAKFLMFTKKYDLVNFYMTTFYNYVPSNLRIVFSGWENYLMRNPHNFPTAWIEEFSDERMKDARPCEGHCATCCMCWNLKDGEQVVFKKHGRG